MKAAWHYLGNFAGIIISFFLYGLLEVFYFEPQLMSQRYHLRLTGSSYGLALAVITVLVLMLIFWFYKRQLREVNDWGFDEKPHWSLRRLLIVVAGFFLITFLGSGMLRLVGSSGATVSNNQEALDRIALHSGNLFKIMVVFIAPFCEETIFRGMFFNTFFTRENTFNKWVGILVDGFVFAFMHDHFPMTKFIFVYWVLGCVLAWVYLQTRDLRYSMLTHMAYNALSLLVP